MTDSAPEREAPLSIRLFGSFDVRLSDKPLPGLRSRKGEWLLALLVLRSERPVSREWLAENLWPDSLPDDARTSLRQSLKDLRGALGDQAWRIESLPGRRLALDLTGAEADVREFEVGVRSGGIESLRRAVGLYRGPLLEGCAETWILAERDAREQAYLEALDRLARKADSVGDHSTAIRYRHLAATAAPLTEPVHRALMTALHQGGDAQAAVEVYQQLRRRLYREYGTEPDVETTALFQEIRGVSRRRQGGTETPKGEIRRPRIGLPAPLNPLIGREAELAEIEGRLLSARLVTLTGTGGVGKTRLAIAAATEAAPQFADGAFFVDLSSVQNELMLRSAVSTALGLEQDLGSLPHLVNALSARQLLVVLDNCEHLLRACAQLVDLLVTQSPHLRILATSREPLGLTGEVRVPIAPLVLPGPTSAEQPVSAAEIERYPAVRLFRDRAAAICPGFQLTDAEAFLVLRLCRCLDGLPLAIELAAALVDVLSPSEILQRLDDRFRLLSNGDPTRPERHQTLQAVVDWSYERLDPEEQRLFRSAAVFSGSWGLAALEAIGTDAGTPGAAIFPVLTRLVRKSLVVPVETPQGTRRYRMLETLRQYARERLEHAGESDPIQRRHLGWLAELVNLTAPKLTGPDQRSALAHLAMEEENLNGALEWALDPRRDPLDCRLASRVARQLGRYWQIRGLYRQGSGHLRRCLDLGSLTETEEDARLQASLLGWTGFLAHYAGQYGYAVERTKESLHAYEELRDDRGRAEALGTLAIAAKDQGDRILARALVEESRRLWEQMGDSRGLAGALGYLGILDVDAGDLDAAERLFEQALALRREIQDLWGIAASLNNLGRLADSRGDLERASDLLEESLALRRELGDRRSMAVTLNSLGSLSLKQGNLAHAAQLFVESLELVTEIGDRRSVAYSLEAAARLAIAAEAPTDGLRLLSASANLRAALPAPLPAAEAEAENHLLEGLRERLGDREFSRVQSAGAALTQAQAVHLARTVLHHQSSTPMSSFQTSGLAAM